MAAYEAISGHQLSLFLTPREIHETYKPIDETLGDRLDADRQGRKASDVMWDRKVQQAKDRGLYDEIQQEGVRKPVSLVSGGPDAGLVGNGHHRLAASTHIDPDRLVPVQHFDNRVTALWADHGGLPK